MKLLVGLGNPGREYERTRHNIGWLVLDEIASSARAAIDRKKFGAEIGEAEVDGVRTLFVKPQTFMNLSGEAVGPAAKFYKIEPRDVIVVHDDLDLDFGRVQIKVGGGHGGHNGLRSVIPHLGSPDFVRIRVGIGRPGGKKEVVGHVLGGFDKKETEELPFVIGRAADAIRCLLKNDATKCMNEFNKRA